MELFLQAGYGHFSSIGDSVQETKAGPTNTAAGSVYGLPSLQMHNYLMMVVRRRLMTALVAGATLEVQLIG